MQKYAEVVLDRKGNVVPGASVRVKTSTGTDAVLYSSNGTGPITNPITTDNLGRFAFYAANGRYNLQVYIGSALFTVSNDILLEDPMDETAEVIKGGTIKDVALTNVTIDGKAPAYKEVTDNHEERLDELEAPGSLPSRVTALEQFDADLESPEGDRKVGHIRNALSGAVRTAGQMLDTVAITPWEFEDQIVSKPSPGDPSTWDWTPAFKAMHAAVMASQVKAVSLSGKFRLVGGLSPTTYIWSGLTLYTDGAEIILDTPTGDNGVFQIGSNVNHIGHLRGSIINGVGNGNGFVRNLICAGNWWNSAEVTNVHFDSLHLTGMADGTAMAIAGNTHGVTIKRLEMGAGQLGLMMHWCGLPNNTAPTSTYHPHDIHIESLVGSGFTEAMITESACYGVRIDYVNGKNNYRDLMHIGGDFGETLAVARDAGRVCKGNSIGRMETTGSLFRAIDYNASAGLVSGIMQGEFSVDSIKAVGTGLASSVGLRFENRSAGHIGFADVTGFVNNISYLNCNGGSDGELRSSLATGQGIIYNTTAHARADVLRTTNDNQAAGGGVGGVNVNAACSDIEIGMLRVATNNAATHGCVLASGSSNIRVRQVNGTVDASRALLVDNASADSNRIGPCFLDTGTVSYSGPDPTVSLSARGHSMSWGASAPSTGTSKRGNITLSTNASAGGKAGTICTTAGANGSTAVHRKWGVIDV